MPRTNRTTLIAVGCLLTGALAGVAGAQVADLVSRPHFLNSGLFTVGPREGADFRVALDDHPAARPTRVGLQFFDHAGAVVASDEVILQPGQSTSLQLREPGVYRAHARILEPNLRLSDRRTVVGTVELFDIDTLLGTKFVCSIGGLGRIPD
jgi:hypothetical protein